MMQRLWAALGPALALALEDGVALVQQMAATEQASLAADSPGRHVTSCAKVPEVCGDGRFNCDLGPLSQEEHDKDITRSTDGRPNPRALCGDSRIASWSKCLNGDLVGAAHLMMAYMHQHLEPDAEYCFAAGHCNNTKVTANTTFDEAEAMCDQIYGRNMWSGIGYGHINMQRYSHMGRKNPYSHMACAEGRWHCDVMYCREHLCGVDTWRRIYGRLSWWEPGSHWAGVIPAARYRESEPAAASERKKPKSRSHRK